MKPLILLKNIPTSYPTSPYVLPKAIYILVQQEMNHDVPTPSVWNVTVNCTIMIAYKLNA